MGYETARIALPQKENKMVPPSTLWQKLEINTAVTERGSLFAQNTTKLLIFDHLIILLLWWS